MYLFANYLDKFLKKKKCFFFLHFLSFFYFNFLLAIYSIIFDKKALHTSLLVINYHIEEKNFQIF